MLRIKNIKIPLDYSQKTLSNIICRELKIERRAIKHFSIFRMSIDARKKNDIMLIGTLDAWLFSDENIALSRAKNSNISKVIPYNYTISNAGPISQPTVVVGSGPAGLFCAYVLARAGLKPIIVERGRKVEQRVKDVFNFWQKRTFDPVSNVQFGEGGAGTFSDGKLNTGISDPRQRFVLETFYENGAPEEILYNAKPHIGTDYLRKVVKNMREKIIELGGIFQFETKLIDIKTRSGRVASAIVEHGSEANKIPAKNIVLAVGHSARDTFDFLSEKGIPMEPKAFSIGLRIEHSREAIDEMQFGNFAGHTRLGAASYKLNTQLSNGRGVYTFCMCPGGRVVAAQSEKDTIVTNGMSDFSRAGDNSNSAILVSVSPKDYGCGTLDGVRFQQRLERAAFSIAGDYSAPVQTVEAFLKNEVGKNFTSVQPSYLPGVVPTNLRTLFPVELSESLCLALKIFESKIPGFISRDAVLTAPETRSSSPVRILRNRDTMQSVGFPGLYPCGEGAGHAGGIISAAVDGIKCAEKIISSTV